MTNEQQAVMDEARERQLKAAMSFLEILEPWVRAVIVDQQSDAVEDTLALYKIKEQTAQKLIDS